MLALSPSVDFTLLSSFFDVDPVLVGMITILLLIVFALFLFIRKTLLSLSEGIREGKRR
jgi:hypothetical protein